MKQTLLGLVFLIAGLVVLLLALTATPISVTLVLIGVGVAVFGAILIPSSGAAPALQSIFVVISPYIPRIGGQRAGDPPAPPPAP